MEELPRSAQEACNSTPVFEGVPLLHKRLLPLFSRTLAMQANAEGVRADSAYTRDAADFQRSSDCSFHNRRILYEQGKYTLKLSYGLLKSVHYHDCGG